MCCQLFHAEPPTGSTLFERRGYRDAGLECAHILKDGSLHGMQAKFFTRAPESSEWAQIDKSVKDALQKNPQLSRLTICIPQNFDDPKIAGQTSAMDKWKNYVDAWRQIAAKQGRTVEFELWGDTQITNRLTKPENRGKRYYFFNQTELTPDWFMERLEEVAADARPRYTKELNVQLPIAQLFEGLGRTTEFALTPKTLYTRISRSLSHLNRSVYPTEAAATISDLLEQGDKLVELLAGSVWEGTAPLRLAEIAELAGHVRELAHEGRHILDDIATQDINEARRRGEKLDSHTEYAIQHKHSGVRSPLWEIAKAGNELARFAASHQAELANQPVLLVSGRAGSGKTHLLVDVAKRRATLGHPSLVMLGENFQDRDPLSQIIELCGLNTDHDTFLQALEAAAEASGGKFLLLIDALNEGAGLQLWPKRLAGLLTKLKRHPWIGVGLSVRTTYESVVVPDGVSEVAIRVTHEGFAANPEQATRAFFVHYGIDLPQVPMLNPEYTNPLFLKLLCKGLQDAGKHEVPAGGDGITAVFEFLIDATNGKLQRTGSLTTPPHQNVVRTYLDRLSDALADRDVTAIPVEEANQISQAVYPTQGYPNSLLALLLSEGLVTKEMIWRGEGEKSEEGVSFAYQRFQDNEVARRLLARNIDLANLAEAFRSDGVVGRLFVENYGFYRHQGLLEALSVQVPEQFGVELASLFDYKLDEDDEHLENYCKEQLCDCLLESLLWRRRDTITDATFEALNASITTGQHEDRYFDILLMLAAVPESPLNANRLDSILRRYKQPERDAWWMEWIYYHHYEESALDRLISWALLNDDKSHLSDEAVLLACVALSWLTSSTVR
ncbi:MAG: hypothetical protein NT023_04165, partial [Armatimonadetes bacterium]|nr:hypothetical protein [Armatimonadota bacterium]